MVDIDQDRSDNETEGGEEEESVVNKYTAENPCSYVGATCCQENRQGKKISDGSLLVVSAHLTCLCNSCDDQRYILETHRCLYL